MASLFRRFTKKKDKSREDRKTSETKRDESAKNALDEKGSLHPNKINDSTSIFAAIDFGTTFSGTAFAFKQDLATEPPKILATQWQHRMLSLKAPTCVLIEKDGETFHCFGYAAESKFGQLAADGDHTDWYYFRHFKMMLYRERDITENTMIEDFTGKRLSALKVFSLCIRYLKDTLRKEVDNKLVDTIRDEDIHWVITVPAIWNDTAKQFMRKAAENAGIDANRLNIALEPEAASLYCRHLPVEKYQKSEGHALVRFEPDFKYLVLDAGGGTVDITVLQTTSEREMKEIHHATGGELGGTKVDKAFLRMLEDIFGSKTLNQFKDIHTEHFNDLLLDFELKKRIITSDMTSKISIRFCNALFETYKEIKGKDIQEALTFAPYKEKITIVGDNTMQIDPEVMRGFFTQSIQNIIDHVESLLRVDAVRDCTTILLVGGYSNSTILQYAIKTAFPSMVLIIPDEPGLAVLKGAVIFGSTPTCEYRKPLVDKSREDKKTSENKKDETAKITLDEKGSLHLNKINDSTFVFAAIDFGTTFSGTAFAFKQHLTTETPKILATQWTSDKMVSLKAPTCVLIEKDGETLHSFGYVAEREYGQLAAGEDHKDWYYFQHFKMMLYGERDITEDIVLEDFTGKKLSALKVFSLCIQYLKDNMRKEANDKLVNTIRDEDIRWVITVPAIWNDTAKQFMRKAAENAGIDGNRLNIALEPEAASLYCRHIPVEKYQGSEGHALVKVKPGFKYLVLDAGGGTVDITVHQTTSDWEMKEIHCASGGDWGGKKVDRAFMALLQEVFGIETMKQFKEKNMEDFTAIELDFELKKRQITSDTTSQVTIRLPFALLETYKEITDRDIKEALKSTPYKEKITIDKDKMRIDPEIMKGFFTQSIQNIIDHVKSLLRVDSVLDCTAILLVGGYSDSKILQDAVRKAFPSMGLIIPDEAGLAVLKGAVIFGSTPKAISERVCKYTYGVATSHIKGLSCNHPPCGSYVDSNGQLRCEDIFDVHAVKGQTVMVDEKQLEQIYIPIYDDQTTIRITVYSSPEKSPSLVTDEGCRVIGQFIVPITGGMDVEVGISLVFGGTEIEVIAEDKLTGNETKHRFDLLH